MKLPATHMVFCVNATKYRIKMVKYFQINLLPSKLLVSEFHEEQYISQEWNTKLLNYTSCDNWRSCLATDKVREGPWTVGEMASLGTQGHGILLSSYRKDSEAATPLSPSWSPTVLSSFLHTLQKAEPGPSKNWNEVFT